MTNVLIPTDFSPASLRHVEAFLQQENLQKCNILLFHAFGLPDLPFELLTATGRDPVCELMNEPFRQACKKLKDEYPGRVGKVLVRCMTGDSQALFRNFVDANDVDLIYCPDNYAFKPAHKLSVDPCYLFRKCGTPVLRAVSKASASTQKQPAFPLQLATSSV
jgi:hypothetical protein